MRYLANQNIMVIDINDLYINIVVGYNAKNPIIHKIDVPEGAVINRNIENVNAIAELIKKFKVEKSIHVDKVVFVIKGQDTIIRHTEVPIMEKDKIAQSVKWEIGQNLPEQGQNHYIDFEVIDRVNAKDIKTNKLIVAAAPKENIDKLVELANKLGMRLTAIDIAANCIARVFSQVYEKDKSKERVGIIQIGNNDSSIVLLEKGKLSIERDLPFGINNIIKHLVNLKRITEEEAEKYLREEININNINEEDEDQVKIKRVFDNMFASFEKVIQFFNTGKTKKNLDKLFIIGKGSEIKEIEAYAKSYFETDASIALSDVNTFIKVDDELQFKDYTAEIGALIRKNNSNELNLLPYELKNKRIDLAKNKNIIIAASVILGVLILFAVIPQIYLVVKQNENTELISKINAEASVAVQNTKLLKQKSEYDKQINTTTVIQKNKTYILEWVQGIVKHAPSNVTVVSINKDKGQPTITIVGQTKDINSVPLFSKNLQDSGKFTDVKITSINSDKDSNYKFTITEKEASK